MCKAPREKSLIGSCLDMAETRGNEASNIVVNLPLMWMDVGLLFTNFCCESILRVY